MAARNEVKPPMYPVLAAEIEMLEANRAVPDDLKRFWLANGCGMFNEETSGRTILQGAAKKLLDPNEILTVLADLDCAEFADGLPFFEMNDCIPLLIGPSGEAFANDTDYVIVVTSTLDGFLERLMADPGFYIPLLGED